MAQNGREIKSRFYAQNPNFRYLPEGDTYLFAFDKPKYRFNLIGSGMMGQEHLRLTLMEGRATIHGVYDPNPLSVEKAKQNMALYAPGSELAVYASLEEACADPIADALIICTPNFTHIDVAKVAAKSGKHVLLEKPMATTLRDAHEIMRIAEGYGAVFQVGLQYRYKSIYREAIHEALERRSLGDIKLVSILEHRIPFLDKVKQWNKFSKYSGGTLVEKCCHYFDLLNLFAQSRPVRVYAAGSQAVNFVDYTYCGETSDILDNAFVTVEYGNGVRAGFNLCMFSPMFHEELVICGVEGRLSAAENEDYLSDPRPRSRLEIVCGEKRASRISSPCYPAHIENSGHNGATFYEHIHFVDNIEGEKTNTATAAEGFWSVVVGCAAEESVKTGKTIDIEALLREQGIRVS